MQDRQAAGSRSMLHMQANTKNDVDKEVRTSYINLPKRDSLNI